MFKCTNSNGLNALGNPSVLTTTNQRIGGCLDNRIAVVTRIIMRIPLLNDDGCETIALTELRFANGCNAFGDNDGSQICTMCENITAYGRHTFREINGCQTLTTAKSKIANGC